MNVELGIESRLELLFVLHLLTHPNYGVSDTQLLSSIYNLDDGRQVMTYHLRRHPDHFLCLRPLA